MKECGVLWKGKLVTYREVLKLGDSTKVNKGGRERERERERVLSSLLEGAVFCPTFSPSNTDTLNLS